MQSFRDVDSVEPEPIDFEHHNLTQKHKMEKK